ncbi:MAG TPA: hypothetical protein PLB48_07875 [Treponema sp.]|nr:hypothetical protein [Treponema sp.]HRS04368.1 hypothetical protein [Treponema sp.]HRU28773.1 hypothetical protein [Treponema sp.]
MKIINKISILTVLIMMVLHVSVPVSAEQKTNDKIPIAIPDVKLFGIDEPDNIQKVTIDTFTSAIITEISAIPYFQVLERQQSNDIFKEIEFQLNTSVVSENINIQTARAILLTGYGTLYDKIVITARLVDLQTSRILFAETIYTDQQFVTNSIHSLAASIREKASELGKEVKLEDVERAVKAKSWKDAKRLADLFLRSNPSDSKVQSLYEVIAENRAKELYIDARRLVRLNLFKEARIAIDEAIALFPKSEYYAYRDTIAQAELDYQYNQKADQIRREEELKTGKVKQGFIKQVYNYLENITTAETHLGITISPELLLTNSLFVDINDIDWGFEMGWVNPYYPSNGKDLRVWSWYAGIYGGYEKVNEGGYGTIISGYFSPLLTQSFRLGPIVLHFGLDGGGFLAYGPYEIEHVLYGYTIGCLSEISVRFVDRIGLFSAVKIDWREYINHENNRSGPVLRFVFGGTL